MSGWQMLPETRSLRSPPRRAQWFGPFPLAARLAASPPTAPTSGVAGDEQVTEIDASTGSIVQNIDIGGSGSTDISSDGTHVWVTSYEDDSVTELDTSDGSVVRTIGVGDGPVGISLDGTNVWSTNYLDNTVSEISASTGRVVQTVPVGGNPDAVSSDGTNVWVTNRGERLAYRAQCLGRLGCPDCFHSRRSLCPLLGWHRCLGT